MSANSDIVRRWIWAFEHDRDAFRELTHPQIEWAPFEENHTVYHGLGGATDIRTQWLESWSEHRMDVEKVIEEGGEDLVVTVHVTARGASSGAEVDVLLHGHMKVREGKVAYLYEHEERADALHAAGLSPG